MEVDIVYRNTRPALYCRAFLSMAQPSQLFGDFELRPYQKKFVDNIRIALAKDKRIIACAATGSGKTKVFISIAISALAKGRTVLIISESRKIFKQISSELTAQQIDAGSSITYVRPNGLYLAMAQTLMRREKLLEAFESLEANLFIINDEAHIATPTRILDALPDAWLIGFTATPSARHGKHLPKIYSNIVVGPQPHELVCDGFLSPYRHFGRERADLSKLEMKGGEYTESSQEAVFDSPLVFEGVAQDLRTVPFTKCIIFCSSIKHCDHLTKELQTAGFDCLPVHSQLGESIESYNTAQFEHGPVPICVSVGILTKGFDCRPIDLVVLNRATTSLPLYLQMIGRGSRIFPGKQEFRVLDYGENWKRHKLWDFAHDWGVLWKQDKRAKEGASPVKNCPECEYICPASASVCPNCGHVFQAAPKPQPETVLIEITQQYQGLIGKRISELTPKELACYAKEKNKKQFAIRVAKSQEQKTPGWLALFAKEMNYKYGWVRYQLGDMTTDPILYHDIILR